MAASAKRLEWERPLARAGSRCCIFSGALGADPRTRRGLGRGGAGGVADIERSPFGSSRCQPRLVRRLAVSCVVLGLAAGVRARMVVARCAASDRENDGRAAARWGGAAWKYRTFSSACGWCDVGVGRSLLGAAIFGGSCWAACAPRRCALFTAHTSVDARGLSRGLGLVCSPPSGTREPALKSTQARFAAATARNPRRVRLAAPPCRHALLESSRKVVRARTCGALGECTYIQYMRAPGS